jgi:hypothetical protein
MKDTILPHPVCSEAACRNLAARVIHQAVRDLSGASASQADQESARSFLSGSPMLYQWCDVAHLSVSRTVARATQLIAASGRPAIRRQDHAPGKHARRRDS